MLWTEVSNRGRVSGQMILRDLKVLFGCGTQRCSGEGKMHIYCKY